MISDIVTATQNASAKSRGIAETHRNALTSTFVQYCDTVFYIRIRIAKFDYAEEKTPNFVGWGHVCNSTHRSLNLDGGLSAAARASA